MLEWQCFLILMKGHKAMKRRILEFLVRLPAILLGSLPILKFIYNIDWVKDLERLPQFLNFINKVGIFNIFGFVGAIYVIAKICLYFIDRGEDQTASKEVHQFFHELRNNIADYSNIDKNIYVNSNDGIEHFYKFVRQTSESLCGNVYNFLKAYTNKEFSVCIKMIDPTSSRSSSSKNEITIETLCRAGKNKTSRESGDVIEKIYLKDNTDFKMIFDSDGSESTNVFATHNLPFYIAQKWFTGSPYKTSTDRPLKKYWSTIVVPIRIENKHISSGRRKDGTLYTLVAYLCIDYRWFLRRYEVKKLKNYLKAMGDSLYPFFEQVMFVDEHIRKNSTN